MITVTVERGADGQIRAFSADNHGRSEVCAAVSMLVINTVNSIEAFTDTAFTCDYRENGGFLRFALTGDADEGAALLLKAMLLGLAAVKARYGDELCLRELINGMDCNESCNESK